MAWMIYIRFLAGVILLTMGRRFYWFFLGVSGFVLGFDLARRLVPGPSHGVAIIAALVLGIIGALVAVALQKFAIAAGGFVVGGYVAANSLRGVLPAAASHYWIVFVVGGIIGAILMNYAFSFALIVLSSLMGAILILQALHYWRGVVTLPFILISAFGIAVQYGLVKPKLPSKKGPR